MIHPLHVFCLCSSVPYLPETSLHIVHLPSAARQEAVCFQWKQEPSRVNLLSNYDGCWAMDNVLVINSASLPESLHDQFDPMDTSNWLFFPGGEIKVRLGDFLSNRIQLIFDKPKVTSEENSVHH